MNHARAHTSLLVLAITVLLVVIAVNFYMRQKVSVSVDHAVLARDIVLAEQQNVANEEGLSQIYKSTADARSRLRSLFIPSDKAVALIEALEGIGTQTGATISLASIAADNLDASAPGSVGSVNVQMSVRGSWPAAMRTLKLVETLPYPISIGTVSLASSGAGPSSKREWQISFGIKAPIIKQ
jgi:hypothetical protein